MCPRDTFGSRHRGGCFDRASEAIRIEGAISDHQGALGEQPRSASRRRGGRLCCHRRGGTRSACRPGLPRRGSCWSGRRASRLPRWLARAPPFSARGASVRLDVASVAQKLGRRAAGGCERAEHALPHALGSPAHEPVVQRLRRAVLARRMPPRATPERSTWTIPLSTRRSSTRGLPRLSEGKSGASRRICASLRETQIAHPGSPHQQGNHSDSHPPASLKELHEGRP
jgi:hypothetical protein